MYHIDIVGMRRRRNLKIIIAIIIISIILALFSIGHILHNKKEAMLASANVVLKDTDNIIEEEQKNSHTNVNTNPKEENNSAENNKDVSDNSNKPDKENEVQQQESEAKPVEEQKNKEFINNFNI